MRVNSLFFIFFILLIKAGYACEVKVIKPGLSGVEELIPKNCLKKVRGNSNQKGLCKCADKNSFIDTEKMPNEAKFVESLVDISKVSLLSISEKLLSHAINSNGNEADLAEICDIRKLDEALSCTGNTYLSNVRRKEIIDDLKSSFEKELRSKFNPSEVEFHRISKLSEGGLISRVDQSCGQGGVGLEKISDELIAKIQKEEAIIYILKLKEIYEQQPDRSKYKTLEEVKDILLLSGKNFAGMSRSLSGKVIQDLLNSEKLLAKINSGQFDAASDLKKEMSNFQSKKNLEELELQCGNFFKDFKKVICTDKTVDIVPNNHKHIRQSLAFGSNLNEVSEKAQINQYLSRDLCQKKEFKKNYEQHLELLKPYMIDRHKESVDSGLSFQQIAQDDYDQNSGALQYKRLICEYMPPPMSNLSKGISENCTQKDDEVLARKCEMIKISKIHFEGRMKTLEVYANKLATQKAEKENPKASKDDLAKKVVQIREELMKNVTFGDLQGTEDNISKSGQKIVLDRTPALIKDFLGEEPSSSQVASDRAGSRSSSRVESDNNASNITGGTLALNNGASNKSAWGAPSRAEQEKKERKAALDQMYKDIANRMVRARNKSSGRNNSTSSGVSVPSYMQNALRSPFPEQTQNSSQVASYDEDFYNPYDAFSDEGMTYDYAGNDSGPAQNNIVDSSEFNNTSQPTQAIVAPKKVDDPTQYMAATRKVMDAYERKKKGVGTVPKSPFGDIQVSGPAGGSRSTAGNGSSGGLISASNLAEWPIGTGLNEDNKLLVYSDLEKLIDNVVQEKQAGYEGENTEHAEYILGMLNPENKKAFYISDRGNKKYKVQIKKKSDGSYRVIPVGNQADRNYQRFVKSVEQSMFKLKSSQLNPKFSTLIKQLSEAVQQGSVSKTIPSGTVRYQDFR